MKKETTGNRLRQAMNDNGLRQVDVLEKAEKLYSHTGIRLSKSDLSQYINDKVEPRERKIELLSIILGVSVAWLRGYDVNKH